MLSRTLSLCFTANWIHVAKFLRRNDIFIHLAIKIVYAFSGIQTFLTAFTRMCHRIPILLLLLWRNSPTRVRVASFLTFLDHTKWHTHTPCGTPLSKRWARRRDLYLTTHNIHNRETSMPPVGSEPAIPASERPQTFALDRSATGIGKISITGFWLCVFIHHPVTYSLLGPNVHFSKLFKICGLVRFPTGARPFFLLQKRLYWLWGPHGLLFSGYMPFVFPGVKWLRLEFDHGTSSSAAMTGMAFTGTNLSYFLF